MISRPSGLVLTAAILSAVATAIVVIQGTPADFSERIRQEIKKRYRKTSPQAQGTLLVVIKEGIPAGSDSLIFLSSQDAHTDGERAWPADVQTKKNPVRVEFKDGELARASSKSGAAFRVGELLVMDGIQIKKREIDFRVRTLQPAPYREDRPSRVDLFERAELRFVFDALRIEDPSEVFSITDRWFKPFDSLAEAMAFKRELAAAGITRGMTFAHVERALGEPERKEVDGQKMYYIYRDIVVEFWSGKALRYTRR